MDGWARASRHSRLRAARRTATANGDGASREIHDAANARTRGTNERTNERSERFDSIPFHSIDWIRKKMFARSRERTTRGRARGARGALGGGGDDARDGEGARRARRGRGGDAGRGRVRDAGDALARAVGGVVHGELGEVRDLRGGVARVREGGEGGGGEIEGEFREPGRDEGGGRSRAVGEADAVDDDSRGERVPDVRDVESVRRAAVGENAGELSDFARRRSGWGRAGEGVRGVSRKTRCRRTW